LQLQELQKNGAFMECNFLEKKVRKNFVELFYSGLLSAIGCQAVTHDDTSEAQ
jgi:hypothetical protein